MSNTLLLQPDWKAIDFNRVEIGAHFFGDWPPWMSAQRGDRTDLRVVITYEGAQIAQQTIARMMALGPWARFVCENDSHPPFITEQQAKSPHVCPICDGPMKRARP